MAPDRERAGWGWGVLSLADRDVMSLRSVFSIAAFAAVHFTGCVGSYEPKDKVELGKGFAFELHHPMPSGVSDLQIRRIVVGDGVGSWLRFKATPDVARMLRQAFSSSDKATFDQWSGGANVPDWWDAGSHHFGAYYHTENWEEGCSTFSHAVLAYDTTAHIVFFAHGGS